MKDIKNKIELLRKEVSNIEDNKNKEVFNSILSLINILSEEVSNLSDRQDSLEENVKYIDEDIIGLQDELFEEVSIEDLMEIEEEYVEIKCKNCNKPLFVEGSTISNSNSIPCPFCNKNAIEK
ncbi:hypothetical protein [Clostridium tertium]|uniref:Uncharacterized protein n=1 Tax=Clostridium tertium TaxID=1559 RepID=A0A6N3GDV1_9CLOT